MNNTERRNLVWRVAQSLPPDGKREQDWLFDLAEGGDPVSIARTCAGISPAELKVFFANEFMRLGISYPYTDPRGIALLRAAFEHYDDSRRKLK